jgi:hypothetical protein
MQKKTLLHCLNNKDVIHRIVRDQVQTRIVCKGGDTTTADLPVPVGAISNVSNEHQLEKGTVDLSRQGLKDSTIAEYLPQEGFRSPLHPTLLSSTVRTIHFKHRIFKQRR